MINGKTVTMQYLSLRYIFLSCLYRKPFGVFLVLSCVVFSFHSCFTSSTLLRLVLSGAHGARAQVPNFDTTQMEDVSIVDPWIIGPFSGAQFKSYFNG